MRYAGISDAISAGGVPVMAQSCTKSMIIAFVVVVKHLQYLLQYKRLSAFP